jgi:hypothetical protein
VDAALGSGSETKRAPVKPVDPERWVIIPERWYTVDETAILINCSRDKVIRLVDQGFLKAAILPSTPTNGYRRRHKRKFEERRIQGKEILRLLNEGIR